MTLALAQIPPNESITKERLRQLNQNVKAQLDWFEASAFPEEETSSKVVYGNAKPCNLYSYKLLALDLDGERSLQAPRQSLGGLRRQSPAMLDRSSQRRDQSGHIACHRQLQATDAVVVVQPSKEDQNAHEANSEKDTSSSGTIGPHLIPHSNITTQNARETYNTSPTTGRELPQDIRGHPVEPGQEGDQRPDIDKGPDPDKGPDSDKGPDPDEGPDPGNVPDKDTNPGRKEEGQVNDENSATNSTTTSDEPPATSKSSSNDPNLSVNEIQPRKKMKLRSDAKAELANSEETCDEASDSEIDTPVAGRPRKRRKTSKTRSKMRNRTEGLSEMAQKFGNVKLGNDFETIMGDSQLGDHQQNLSVIRRQRPSQTIASINPQQFIQGLSMYRKEVESNLVGEQICRLRYRIIFRRPTFRRPIFRRPTLEQGAISCSPLRYIAILFVYYDSVDYAASQWATSSGYNNPDP